MGIAKDVQQTYERFGIYIDQLTRIIGRYGISKDSWTKYPQLAALLTTNPEARSEIGELLKVVVALDGGKLSLSTLGSILALSVGGIGVAAMGSAFGIPAMAITLLGTAAGALVGNELDDSGFTSKVVTAVGFQPASIGSGHENRKGMLASGTDEGDHPEQAAANETERTAKKGPISHLNQEYAGEDPKISLEPEDTRAVQNLNRLTKKVIGLKREIKALEATLASLSVESRTSFEGEKLRSNLQFKLVHELVLSQQKQASLLQRQELELQRLTLLVRGLDAATEAQKARSTAMQDHLAVVIRSISSMGSKDDLRSIALMSKLKIVLYYLWVLVAIAALSLLLLLRRNFHL